MRSRDDNYTGDDLLLKVTWLLLAVAINGLELLIPRIPVLPWLKPGFANIITILWIVRFGATDALLYTIIRTWISGFYFGFSMLTMGLGLTGGILATLAMSAAWQLFGRRKLLGTIGMGMIGALAHNAGQLGAVYLMMARNALLFYQLPFMFGAALVFGGTVGGLAPRLLRWLDQQKSPDSATGHIFPEIKVGSFVGLAASGSLVTMAFCFLLFFTDNLFLLLAAALLTTITALICTRLSIGTFLYPLRFWMFFLAIGSIHLFFSYGTRIESIPVITIEGLRAAAAQTLRLWAWLEVTLIFRKLHFHDFFFRALQRVFPGFRVTLTAGLLALELFPEMIKFTRRNNRPTLQNWARNPVQTARRSMTWSLLHIQELLHARMDSSAP